MDKIDQKIDKILEVLNQQSNTLAKHSVLHEKNTEDLEKHIKRTDLLEEEIKFRNRELAKDMEPIKRHVAHIEGAIKLIGILSMVVGFIASISKLLF